MLSTYFWLTLSLVLTPGATTTVVVRQALQGGLRGGVATAAGAAVANSTHAAAAGLGLAVVLTRVPMLAGAIASAGALFLLWLAVGSFRRAWRATSMATRVAAAPAARSAFRDGLLVNLLNPAIATFYLVVVPTFMTPGAPWWRYLLLAGIHVGLAFLCHVGWSALIDRVRQAAHSTAALRVLDVLAGVALAWLAWRALPPAWQG